MLSMLSAAWSEPGLLQGTRTSDFSPMTGPGTSFMEEGGGAMERLSWLLPLTLSALLNQDSWSQITGKVNGNSFLYYLRVVSAQLVCTLSSYSLEIC